MVFCRETAFKILDKGLLEIFGPYSLVRFFTEYSERVANVTTGYIFHYAFLLIAALGGLFFMNIFVLETINFELVFFQIFLTSFFFLTFTNNRIQ